MVRDRVVEVEFAEPPVRQMQFDFLAQSPFGANAEAVPHEQHPDHEFGIDRRPPDLGIVRRQFLVQVGERQRDEHVHAPEQVGLGDPVFEPELVEKLALISLPPPHHWPRPIADRDQTTESPFGGPLKPFLDSIGPKLTSALLLAASDSPNARVSKADVRSSRGSNSRSTR